MVTIVLYDLMEVVLLIGWTVMPGGSAMVAVARGAAVTVGLSVAVGRGVEVTVARGVGVDWASGADIAPPLLLAAAGCEATAARTPAVNTSAKMRRDLFKLAIPAPSFPHFDGRTRAQWRPKDVEGAQGVRILFV